MKIINSSRILSYDVIILFTNVPVNESKYLSKTISDNTSGDDDVKEEIMFLFNVYLNQNYLTFNDNYYK